MKDLYSGIAEILEVPEDSVDASFDLANGEQEWDSMAVVSTIALVDNLYDVALDGVKLAECETVADIEKLIKENS
ncbi:acyl carrier protein [Pseudidiomarina aquimaris]|uniref:Acyl carrier protein n=1 Tax=Pseudidiomarina aquimaris TaxID=641841 RepID=A0A432XDA0_9GAMM|nr:phosphopantetheine-binding protein [Pseudidiomarina aquimaris]RUO46616.1 acyl carrier protein [Pseudidiomarina aquimaris]